MVALFDETRATEFFRFDYDRAQAWLRGEGVRDAMVYRDKNQVAVEVPAGTPNELLMKAVSVGKKQESG